MLLSKVYGFFFLASIIGKIVINKKNEGNKTASDYLLQKEREKAKNRQLSSN